MSFCIYKHSLNPSFIYCRKAVVIGAGYIAVELAGILNALGTETHSLIRYDKVLRTFDESICQLLTQEIESSGINLHKHTQVSWHHRWAQLLQFYIGDTAGLACCHWLCVFWLAKTFYANICFSCLKACTLMCYICEKPFDILMWYICGKRFNVIVLF